MTSQRSVVFAEPIRTAIGTFGGSLKDMPALSQSRRHGDRAAVARAGLRPDEVQTVVMGNVVQAGTKMNPARRAAVHAGLPVTVPALTVNRVCGSGAQAIVSAAQEIALGNIDVAVAGGMENMDQAPYLIARGRWGYRMGDGALYDSVLRDGLNDAFSDAHSGWHTEDLVEKYQVTRDAQDRWALRSQQRFAAAQAAGHFKSQIVPVEVPGKKGPTQFDKDEANRPDTTLEALARLKPAFRPNGTITAGNAPGLNDDAAAMVVADAAWVDKRGLKPAARLVAYGIAAVEPGMFGLGPVPAVKQALQRAGWTVGSVERVEINEAFAAIAIVVARELGFADDIVNVEGGAVAQSPTVDKSDRSSGSGLRRTHYHTEVTAETETRVFWTSEKYPAPVQGSISHPAGSVDDHGFYQEEEATIIIVVVPGFSCSLCLYARARRRQALRRNPGRSLRVSQYCDHWPVKTGTRFSTNARAASLWSLVRPVSI
jgi:acetyl-CoA C-acetyltransferase